MPSSKSRKKIFVTIILLTTLVVHISTSWNNSFNFLAPASDASCLHGVGDMPSVAGGYFFMRHQSKSKATPGYKLSIEEINLIKPEQSEVIAISFAEDYRTPKGMAYRRITCICGCGTIFTTLLSSVTQGRTLSCGCLQMDVLKKSGYSIADINSKKPKYSRLTAISFAESKRHPNGQPYKIVNALCVCGNKRQIAQADIIKGHTISCGCYEEEVLAKRNTKYSHTLPKINSCWHSMMKRCYNPKASFYNLYGGRGVKVCNEWHNYQNFLNWAIDKWKPGLQLDKDKLGDGLLYSPDTCCFLTKKENNPYNMKKAKNEIKS